MKIKIFKKFKKNFKLSTKEGVKFSVTGELGTGNITCRQGEGAVDDVIFIFFQKKKQNLFFLAVCFVNHFVLK